MAWRPHLLVIDPSVRFPEDEGVAEVLHEWRGTSTVVRAALEPESLPGAEAFRDADGIVVLGSHASANEVHHWLHAFEERLRPVVDGTWPVPLLGICFGHQLIARLAGASIGLARKDGTMIRGIVETALEGGRLVPGQRTLVVVASHREAVQDVPPGFDVTARRPGSPIDGLEHRERPVFTFQFHPEAREGFLARRGVDMTTVDRRFLEDGRMVLAAFRRFVLSRRAV